MTTPLNHTKCLEAGVLFELIVRLLGVDSTTKKAFLESCKTAHEESYTKHYGNGSWFVQLQSTAHGGVSFHHCQGILDEYYFAAELDRLRYGSRHDYGSAEFKALDAIDRRCKDIIYGFRNGSEVHDPSSDRIERLRRVNTWIDSIARRGRKFFSDDGAMRTGRVAQFEFTDGKLWYRNQYDQLIWANAQKDLFLRKFAGGGTLAALAWHLRDYIFHGTLVPTNQIWWPSWYSDGDLWDYGATAMDLVRLEAYKLGLIQPLE